MVYTNNTEVAGNTQTLGGKPIKSSEILSDLKSKKTKKKKNNKYKMEVPISRCLLHSSSVPFLLFFSKQIFCSGGSSNPNSNL